MKRLIFATALVFSGPAAAITPEVIEVCGSWGQFAELTMRAHQASRPLAEQMALSPDERAYDITLEAYRTPRFTSEISQISAGAHFRDKITAECLAALSDPENHDLPRPEGFWAITRP